MAKMKKIVIVYLAFLGLFLSCSPEKMPDGKTIVQKTTQDPIETPSITASETTFSFSADGGSSNVTITANFAWETISSPSWITVSPSSGSNGSTSLTIKADKNTDTTSRTGTITIGKSSSATVSITVTQSEASLGTITVNGVSFKMIKVDGGTFTMGATSEQGGDAFSDEMPTHSVTLSDYYMGETEVTQELWEAVMNSNPSDFKGSKRPVENVSWDDCQTFIVKLKEKTGKSFRLPTEAEWEYAARGRKSEGFKYAGSNNIDEVAWYVVNSYYVGSSSPDYGTHNVGTKKANELGLYDMSGNVWEWCQDWYGSYSSNSQTNPTGASSGSSRVSRGGGWGSSAGFCRVSYRSSYSPDLRYYYLGLRLAL